ncbi:hypothetical protein [Sphingomonas sp. 35-24ZXX]|uniref:hypothetical protein n=1 Tax=Sphingomonas sp. 35-24ZXX TaxID=1545915 RepID=UPI00053C059A|nr:hypothetical protein [Sphingomonas sp. 35-24ZXX]
MRSSIRELARAIYFSEGEVDLYSLHISYRLSPAEILYAARFFAKVGLADFDGVHFVLHRGAREWLFKRRHRFFLEEERPWSIEERLGLDPSQPYLPDVGRVDRQFFYRKLRGPEGAVIG